MPQDGLILSSFLSLERNFDFNAEKKITLIPVNKLPFKSRIFLQGGVCDRDYTREKKSHPTLQLNWLSAVRTILSRSDFGSEEIKVKFIRNAVSSSMVSRAPLLVFSVSDWRAHPKASCNSRSIAMFRLQILAPHPPSKHTHAHTHNTHTHTETQSCAHTRH